MTLLRSGDANNETQPLNALAPIEVNESVKSKFVSKTQSLNASAPTVCTPAREGSIYRLVQPENISDETVCISTGPWIFCRATQFLKQRSPNSVT